MNRDELKTILASKRVNESLYSIDELARQSESYSIVREGNSWKVVYKERGEFTEIGKDLTEDEACEMVYGKFKSMFGWAD